MQNLEKAPVQSNSFYKQICTLINAAQFYVQPPPPLRGRGGTGNSLDNGTIMGNIR